MEKRLGILGGTFDPVHWGHIKLAQAVAERLTLDRVLFIPALTAPHKQGLTTAPAEHRYNMTRLAVQDCAGFAVSDLELRRRGVSYTVETLRELKRRYAGWQLYFIIGGDSVSQLPTWHRITEQLELAVFVAAGRPGYTNAGALDSVCAALGESVRQRILLLDTPEYSVSSTEIRSLARQHASLAGLTPAAVERYIYEHGLYGSADKDEAEK